MYQQWFDKIGRVNIDAIGRKTIKGDVEADGFTYSGVFTSCSVRKYEHCYDDDTLFIGVARVRGWFSGTICATAINIVPDWRKHP